MPSLMLRETIEELGECPRCGGIASYTYEVEGLVDTPENVTIRVRVDCDICGYRDTKKIIVPLKALVVMKYLLTPRARLAVEKIRVLTSIKRV